MIYKDTENRIRKEAKKMSVKYDYSYLRGFIREHFGSNEHYARFLGIGTTALYSRLACNVPFRQNEIDATAKFGNLSGNDIMRLFFTKRIRKSV